MELSSKERRLEEGTHTTRAQDNYEECEESGARCIMNVGERCAMPLDQANAARVARIPAVKSRVAIRVRSRNRPGGLHVYPLRRGRGAAFAMSVALLLISGFGERSSRTANAAPVFTHYAADDSQPRDRPGRVVPFNARASALSPQRPPPPLHCPLNNRAM